MTSNTTTVEGNAVPGRHTHRFLAASHAANERKTWTVIVLCGVMMLAEIIGGLAFGSIALVADGLHMSTHAGALLLAAAAYTYARKHATTHASSSEPAARRLGRLYECNRAGDDRHPDRLRVGRPPLVAATDSLRRGHPNRCAGTSCERRSAWLLSGGQHHGPHGDDRIALEVPGGQASLEVHEDGVPPRFDSCSRRTRVQAHGPSPSSRCGPTARDSVSRCSIVARSSSRLRKSRSRTRRRTGER